MLRTYSFKSANFIGRNSEILPMPLESNLGVSTPNSDIIVVDSVCKSCTLDVADREMVVDLVIMEMRNFDIILGMDWLAMYYATVDYFRKIVNFRIPD